MNFYKIAAGITDVGEADFQAEILQSKLPALVLFWAPWSQPCHVLVPIIKVISDEYSGRVKVVKINADNNPGLGVDYEVQFIPTLLLFVAGRERIRITGTVSKSYLHSKLLSVLQVSNSQTPISETNHLKQTL